jgi:methyl-accepting chemotaxis protein
MNNLMNLSIRQRLLVAFGFMLAALVGVSGYSLFAIRDLEQAIRLEQSKEAYLGRAQSALWELRYGFPQFLVLTDLENRRKIVDAEPGLYRALEDNLKAYGDSEGLTPEETLGYKTTSDAWNTYKVRRAQWFTYIAEGRMEEAAAWRAQYTTPLGAATVKSFLQLIDLTSKRDAERRRDRLDATHQAKVLMAVFGALAVGSGLLATLFVLRSMLGHIARLQGALDLLRRGDYSARVKLRNSDELGAVGRALDRLLDERLETLNKQAKENEKLSNSVVEIMQAMGQVAAQKDLSIKVPVTEDVTGAIGDAMNLLTTETAKVLGTVKDVSNDVSSASMLVKQSSDSAMNTASQGQAEVESAARELSNAAATLNQLAQMAHKANESAELAVRTTLRALGTVDKTVVGINESRNLIRETEKRIKRLGERSQEISQVVGLINSIAERTGILALNASMQAVAAGDAGRGFAIVADEVKRLSENARDATREIATLVSSIQSETSETVLAMNNAIAQVVDVSKLADQAGTEMKGTQQATDDLVANVRLIASTSIEQARAGQALQGRAQAIQQSSRDTTRQLSAQNEVTNKLVAYAQLLVREVAVFKLPRRRLAE